MGYGRARVHGAVTYIENDTIFSYTCRYALLDCNFNADIEYDVSSCSSSTEEAADLTPARSRDAIWTDATNLLHIKD